MKIINQGSVQPNSWGSGKILLLSWIFKTFSDLAAVAAADATDKIAIFR